MARKLRKPHKDRVMYWSKRWENKDSPWHRPVVHNTLINFFDQITGVKEGPCRIFVPLCGKSLDLKWMYDQGHEVVGLDGVEKPILEFFEEQGLPCINGNDGLPFFATVDGKLKIYHCDLFALDTSVCGKFDGIWDRGSLVAIFPEDRVQYAALMKNVLQEKSAYLVSSMEYNQSQYPGPPRSVPVEEIQLLFGDYCDIDVLEKIDKNANPTSPDSAKMRWNVDECYEVTLVLKPKCN